MTENQSATAAAHRPEFIQGIIDFKSNKELSQALVDKDDLQLIIDAKAGDLEALDVLVYSRMPLVQAMAESFKDKGVDYFDLIQEGDLGLMGAIYEFDTTSGEHFSKYIVSKIRKAMDNIVQCECKHEDSQSFHAVQDIVETLLSTLPDQHREILRMRFGFGSYRGHTLTEVSHEFGIPIEDVQKLEDDAIKKIRKIWPKE